MNETKRWWKSRGVLGGVTAVSAGLLSVTSPTSVVPDLTTALVAMIFGASVQDAAEVVRLLSGLASIVGGLLAVYGRIKATRAISAKGA